MGGGSGGSYTPINIEQITKAANERIQSAFREQRAILFVCHSVDRAELLSRIERSDALKKRAFDVSTEGDSDLDRKLKSASLVVLFSDESTEHDHINSSIRAALDMKRQIVYVKSDRAASIPAYVTQFRIRTVSWSGLLEILAG